MKPGILILGSICAATGLAAFLTTSTRVEAATMPYQVFVAGSSQPASGAFRTASDAAPKVVVFQKDKTFHPASIVLEVGDTVEIANDDSTVHNAYCQSGEFRYNSGPQQPGSASRVTFTAAGTYEVRCAIHPKMKLTVNVAE